MPKRKDPRVSKKFIVSFNDNGFEELGLTKNLSKSGICIGSQKEVPSKKEIIVSIAVPGEVFNLKGEVIWCSESDDLDDNVPDSIGIKIVEAPVEYLNFVEYMRHQGIEPGKPEF